MNEITAAILKKNHHMVLSTVRADGSPWAVPVHFAFDQTTIYWVSNSETVHSLNINDDNRVFIIIFDSYQTGNEPGEKGAVYISTTARELTGDEAISARSVYFERYPDRNVDKFNEWSIYNASIGELDKTKSVAEMMYHTNEKEKEEKI